MPDGTYRPSVAMTGFGLIENLVTLFVLTVGLLGLAGLQVTSLRMHHQAFSKQRAINLATDMAERMRANPVGVNGKFYLSGEKHVSACYTVKGCSAENMARNDLWEWNQSIQNSLPGGAGFICKDSTPSRNVGSTITRMTSAQAAIASACDDMGPGYTIWIVWDANNDGSLGNPFSFDINGDSSYMMTFEP